MMIRQTLFLALFGLAVTEFKFILSLGPPNDALMIYDDFAVMDEATDYVSENLDDLPTETTGTQRIVSETTISENKDSTTAHETEITKSEDTTVNGNTVTTMKSTESASTTQRNHQIIPCFLFPCDKLDEAKEKIRDKINEHFKELAEREQSLRETKKNILNDIQNAIQNLYRAAENRDNKS